MRDDAVLGRNAVSADLVGRALSREGDSGEDVHDQVDPEELHNIKGRVTQEDAGANHKEHGDNVDSQLELNELAHVVLDVAAPLDGRENREEVVVSHDHISVVLGGRAAVLAHSEANVSLAEGPRITETFTSHADNGVTLPKGAHKHVFNIRRSSVDEEDKLLQFLEVVPALSVLEDPRLTAALLLVLIHLHPAEKLLFEFLSANNCLFFKTLEVIFKTEADGDGLDGGFVVSGDDSDVRVGVMELVESFVDVFAQRVFKTNCGEVDKVTLEVLAALLSLKVLVVGLFVGERLHIDVLVGEADALQAKGYLIFTLWLKFLDQSIVNGLQVAMAIVAPALEVSDLAVGVDLAGAERDDFLRGTLHDNADELTAILVDFVGHSHHLAVRAEGDPAHQLVVVLTLDHHVLDRLVLGGDELEETDLDGAADGGVSSDSFDLAHLHVGIAVQNDGLVKHPLDSLVELKALGLVDLVDHVNPLHFEVASGQSGGLAGDDVDDLACSLESIKVLDEKVLLLERVNREGHSHGDDEGHTFGDADGKESGNGAGKVDGGID